MPSVQAVLDAISTKRIILISPFLSGDGVLTTKWLQATKASLQCEVCGQSWETAFDNLTRKTGSTGCPKCAKEQRRALLIDRGRQQIEMLVAQLGYAIIGDYYGHFERLDLRCEHGHEFRIAPTNLRKQRCPTCSGTSQHLGIEKYIDDYIAGTTWRVVSGLSLKCSCCCMEKTVTSNHVRSSRSLPVEQRHCNCQRYGKKYREIVQRTEGYELLEVYKGMKTPILHRHTACGTTWLCQPSNFSRGTRCPTCARSGRSSSGQRQIAEYLRTFGVRVEENVSGLDPAVPRSEVDIFLPDHGVAVEFDGVWWHAEGPSRERTRKSRPSAQPDAIVARLERLTANGVRLIRVFSDEWAYEKETIKSVLRMAVDLEDCVFDVADESVSLDRRLATAAHERALGRAGYTTVGVVPPSCTYVHPSFSNTRVHFDSDAEAIAEGYSRVWDSGQVILSRT